MSLSATDLVEIDAVLERTEPGVFIAHRASPVGATLTRLVAEEVWQLVPWDARDDDFFRPRPAYRSRGRRRALETFATLVSFWRSGQLEHHPWWNGEQPVERDVQ